MIICRDCQQPFPKDNFPHLCQNCGGLFVIDTDHYYEAQKVEPGLAGIWRYRHSFGLPEGAPVISLGEGNTPLIWSDVFDRKIGFKLESLNPTGSFKDRGTAVLISWLAAFGVKEAVEDSSGNAGASFAAYAARSGIRGKIFIPSYASGPKRAQIESYGQQVISVPGPRSKAAEAVLQEVQGGAVYASHAYLPQGTTGIATIAYELIDQMDKPPGSIILPVGHGSLLLGVVLGFKALLQQGRIPRLPRIIGVQAEVCAPLYSAYNAGLTIPEPSQEGKTLAEGVAISTPYHGKEVLRAVRESEGIFLTVEEDQIRAGHKNLAHMGIHTELTSALVWNALEQIGPEYPDPIVSVITGHGLKGI